MNRFKKVTLFDTEKNMRTGRGMTTVNIKINGLTEDEIKEEIKIIREDQKLKNREFKINNKNGITTGPKFKIKLPKVKVLKTLKLQLDKNTGNTTAILGSSKTGKTTVMMHIFEKFYNKPKFINSLFSRSPQILLYKGRKNLLKGQGFGIIGNDYIELQSFINTHCNNKYPFINFFDDILDMRFNKILRDLVLTLRNSNLSFVGAMQATKLLSKDIRGNVNNIIAMNFNNEELAEDVINIYLKSSFIKLGLNTPNERLLFYKKMTKDRGFIYIDPLNHIITFHRIPLETLIKKRN